MNPRDFSPFDAISPIDSRYYGVSRDEGFYRDLNAYLSEGATMRYQMKVEQALVAELERRALAPAGTSACVAEAVAQVTAEEIFEEEDLRTHHNIRAIVNCIARRIPEQMRSYVHLFATSNDIMDTARAAAMRDVTREVLLPRLAGLVSCIARLASDKKARLFEMPQIGRTHGRFAEPITVGYWLANYVARLGERHRAIEAAARNLRGKFSGAVGAHSAIAVHFPDDPAEFETAVLGRLGLRPSDGAASTQVVHPEFLVDFAHAVVSMVSVCANLADDFRHLMRSEIEEVGEKEGTYRGRVGSSTMPHKVNPKGFENVKSLWKALMPRMSTVYMDQICEHQRDLTNSASGRFFNEMVAIAIYAVGRLQKAIEEAEVLPEKVKRNFEASAEMTVAEPLYIALALDGHKDPYGTSRSLVDAARKRGIGLLTLLNSNDPAARAAIETLSLPHRQLVLCPEKYIGDCSGRTELICEEWLRFAGAETWRQSLAAREELELHPIPGGSPHTSSCS